MEAIVNIENYPRIEDIYAELKRYPNTKLIDAAGIAKESGNARAVNMVMAGAASRELPEIKQEVFEACIREMWTGRNPDTNIDAFRKGRDFQ
jgi:indolepyruvate ferredoxin oxidoreductase beta subunit